MVDRKHERIRFWAVLPACLLIVLLSLPAIQPSVVAISSDTPCSVETINAMSISLSATLDNSLALALAASSLAYQNFNGAFGLKYLSLYNAWAFDLNTCTLRWNSVNPVFQFNKTGGIPYELTIEENPQLTAILDTYVNPVGPHFGSTSNSTNWSGYEYYQSGGVSNGVSAYWGVPSVSYSSTIPSYCANGVNSQLVCTVAIWVGASIDAGGSGTHNPEFAQGGSLSNLTCNSKTSCSSPVKSYGAFYEFPPANPIHPNLHVSANDNFEALVTYSNSQATVSDYDLTSGHSISSTPTTMLKPYYGEFVAEYPPLHNALYFGFFPLPDFSLTTVSGAQVNGYNIYGLSWTTKYLMDASGTGHQSKYNIAVGAVSYSRSLGAWFTQTWQTSINT